MTANYLRAHFVIMDEKFENQVLSSNVWVTPHCGGGMAPENILFMVSGIFIYGAEREFFFE